MVKVIVYTALIGAVIAAFIAGVRAYKKKNAKISATAALAFSALAILVPLISDWVGNAQAPSRPAGNHEPGINITLDPSAKSTSGINIVPDFSAEEGHTVHVEEDDAVNVDGDENNTIGTVGNGNNINQQNVINNYYGNGASAAGTKYAPPDFYPDFEQVESYLVGCGDSYGGRTSYTLDEINAGAIDGKVVFNSISDSPPVGGHEFDFVGARENTGVNQGRENKWSGSTIQAQEGKTYLVRLYAHNNSRRSEDTAEDVSVRFLIGETKAVKKNEVMIDGVNSGHGYYGAAVYGFIYASNAEPEEYSDGVKFVSDRPFRLQYIPGTALYENNGVGSWPGRRLSDDVIRDGVPIGYSSMDGRIPACYKYASYTTIVVMPVFEDCREWNAS